ncbi:MAG: DUF1275 domain-containing protein [Actinobacteria bacterium]|nr:DUF1275 domain-containing protein [Actinomycetota bacterium]
MTGIKARPESLPVGLLLSLIGGYLDAYTFVLHGVFANAQTGNVVLFGVFASDSHWRNAGLHLLPVVAFVVGVAVAETLGRPAVRGFVRRPVRVALGLEILVLAIIGALPHDAPTLVVTMSVGFAAAIQFAVFRKLVDTPWSSLLASGNLRGMTAAAHRWLLDRQEADRGEAARLGAVVLAFVVGAFTGALGAHHLHNHAAAIAAGLVVIALIYMVVETHGIEHQLTVPAPPTT